VTNLLLTLNAGSSSVKFAVYGTAGDRPEALAGGQVEGLGAEPSFIVRAPDRTVLAEGTFTGKEGPADHAGALGAILRWIDETYPDARVLSVGHRVVHGGVSYAAPVVVDDRVFADLRTLVPLAPLHQPHNLAGIAAARAAFPGSPQVACFDTAFHRSHPFVADVFAIPRRFYDEGVRRYGFHGLSYEFIVRRLREIAPVEANGNMIIAHLGNGASMCAVRDGRSIASTMGFTALDGLPMGTRCGQLDPGVLLYLMSEKGMDAAAISDLLYKDSGLKGLSGISHDMRELEGSDSAEARDAIDYFVFRIRREMGALAAVLGKVDAVVFTGGIGENARQIRAKVLAGMEWLGIVMDTQANEAGSQTISTPGSRVKTFVVRTDEEAMIAAHTLRAAGLSRSAMAAE